MSNQDTNKHAITQKQIDERLEKFKIWLDKFAKFNLLAGNNQINYINENMPEVLNEVYWNCVKDYIHTNITAKNGDIRANQYKIISGTELAITIIQPITHNDAEKRRELNAALAWFISLTIYQKWEEDEGNAVEEEKFLNILRNNEIAEFKQEHLIWLEKLDPEFEYPIFCNSQVWRLFDTAVHLLSQQS